MDFTKGLLLAAAGVALLSQGAYADEARMADYGSAKKASAVKAYPEASMSAKEPVNDYRENYVGLDRMEPASGSESAPAGHGSEHAAEHASEPADAVAPAPAQEAHAPEAPADANYVAEKPQENISVSAHAEPMEGMEKVEVKPAAAAAIEVEKPVAQPPVEKTAMAVGATESMQKAPAAAHGGAHWGYMGSDAPSLWGSLDPAYEACAAGKKQSPINIAQFAQGQLPAIEMMYKPTSLNVVNNGHTVQVDYAPGSSISLDGKTYQLMQFHFHTPSEHYLDGSPYPMEAHFVHKADDGSLAVIGVMMKVGAHNPVIEGIWQNAPRQEGRNMVEAVSLDASQLMPSDKGYYKYEGSLTTPPCSEGVKWQVLKTPVELSQEQLQAFQNMFPVNARPVQPLEGRVVMGN